MEEEEEEAEEQEAGGGGAADIESNSLHLASGGKIMKIFKHKRG